MAKNGLDLYLKALEKLQLYASATYKNGPDILKCSKQEKLTTFTPPELYVKATATNREMWKICPNNSFKQEELLQANLQAMYTVVMSIADTL